MPGWLYVLSIISLLVGVLCMVMIIVDLGRGYRQRMWIMNVVWPLTALYAGPLGLWGYYRLGRLSSYAIMMRDKTSGRQPQAKTKPFWQKTVIGVTHCGSGCTLGDIVGESLTIIFPLLIFGQRILAAWVLDFILAFLFGIAFQYFTIKPMKNLSTAKGLIAALKADTLSLTAWQIGMYGWMAIVTFGILDHELDKTGPVFWFMMQIAMLAGFLTSYPVNWWLIKRGIKESM